MSQAGMNNNTGGGGGGGPITTIDGDVGFVTGSTVTIKAGISTLNSGSSVEFVGNDATVMTMNVTDSNNNTMVGNGAGKAGMSGTQNAAFGQRALESITTGPGNTSIGYEAGNDLTTGQSNTFLGNSAGALLPTGSFNNIIGEGAGGNYSGAESSNICIANNGVTGESNVIRIGTQGTGNMQQNTCFVAGINGNTLTSPDVVTIDTTTGQLGVAPFPGGGGSFSGFQAYLSASQINTTGNGTPYSIPFDLTNYNTGGFDILTGMYTATATGHYLFTGTVYAVILNAGETQATISLSTSATDFQLYTVNSFLMAGNATLVLPWSKMCAMTIGDTATVVFTVAGGGVDDVEVVGGNLTATTFEGVFLG